MVTPFNHSKLNNSKFGNAGADGFEQAERNVFPFKTQKQGVFDAFFKGETMFAGEAFADVLPDVFELFGSGFPVKDEFDHFHAVGAVLAVVLLALVAGFGRGFHQSRQFFDLIRLAHCQSGCQDGTETVVGQGLVPPMVTFS